jgi:RNA polymerase sigma factor FliA
MVSIGEEQTLWSQYTLTGSAEIREQLVLQGVPLVYYMVGRMGITRAMGTDYEDLVQQGLMGLIDAVDRFDSAMGTRFSTYASIRIRGKIIDYMRASDWMSRLSRRRVRRIEKGINEFWIEHHHAPSDDELAAFLEMDVEEIQQGLTDSTCTLVSLDLNLPGAPEEEDQSLYEIQADEKQVDPGDLFVESDRRAQLARAIRQLSEREQQVLSLYYYEELTLKEIGKVLEISESRVCQLHTRAILNIKAILKVNDE